MHSCCLLDQCLLRVANPASGPVLDGMLTQRAQGPETFFVDSAVLESRSAPKCSALLLITPCSSFSFCLALGVGHTSFCALHSEYLPRNCSILESSAAFCATRISISPVRSLQTVAEVSSWHC